MITPTHISEADGIYFRSHKLLKSTLLLKQFLEKKIQSNGFERLRFD